MTLKKVYYFTEKVFRTKGLGGYYELVCIRMLENDHRINKYYQNYYNKGNIFIINYNNYTTNEYDLSFEKNQLRSLNKYDRISKIIIKDINNENPQNEL